MVQQMAIHDQGRELMASVPLLCPNQSVTHFNRMQVGKFPSSYDSA